MDQLKLPNSLSVSDWQAIRNDFPLLTRTVRGGKQLVYLDSGATSQKPDPVLDAEADFNLLHNAAVHRGAHQLAEEATEAFEQARRKVAGFVGAEENEIVWTMNATAGINLLAYAFSNASLGRGGNAARRFALDPNDEIVVTELEHHANFVPWQELAARTGAKLKWVQVDDEGRLRTEQLGEVITERTKIVAFTHVSNVTGAVTDVSEFVAAAKRVGAYTVLDACQSAPHLPLDVKALGVDFAVLSAHKLYGPTGVGALYGRYENLVDLPVVTTGGSMVERVSLAETTYMLPPQKFEAGTQMVAQTIGFGAAVDYLGEIGMHNVADHENLLAEKLLEIQDIPGITLIGPRTAENRLAIAAFTIDGVHPHDGGQVLDDYGIAVRVGHHCAQPVHQKFGIAATVRASVGIYNTVAEIEVFIAALKKVRPYFGLN